MKTPAALSILLLLCACGGGQGDSDAVVQENGNIAAAPVETEPMSVECAINGGPFTRTCTVEQAQAPEGVILTIRNEEGGFRRLIVTPNGRIEAADGAERAEVALVGDTIVEVAIGTDRYRLPAPEGVAPLQGQ